MTKFTKNGQPHLPIFCDWAVNEGRPEIQLLLVLFRLAQRAKGALGAARTGRLLAAPLVLPYIFYSRFWLAFDVPPSTTIGPRCRVFHAHGIVINASTSIGSDAVLRHGATLGSRVSGSDAPNLGDRVELGANVLILGAVTIGDDCIIGAGSLVLESLPASSVTVAGAKARVLPRRDTTGTV